jgi:tRNA(adenine34) deaminase
MQSDIYSDEYYMREALRQAGIAFENDEIPVGCIVVCKNRIVAKAYNQTEKLNDATAHAEMIALTSAFNYLGAKYLTECTLFVTLEPCVMCAGAMYWAQLGRLVYGVNDPKRGFSRKGKDILHPGTEVISNISAMDCKQIIDKFFIKIRNQT